MHDCIRANGYWGPVAYFVSFMIATYFLLINLIVAIIVEQFSFMMRQEGALIKPAVIGKFVRAWARCDTSQTRHIPMSMLPRLLAVLPEPLVVSDLPPSRRLGVLKQIGHVPQTSASEVHFVEAFVAIVKLA